MFQQKGIARGFIVLLITNFTAAITFLVLYAINGMTMALVVCCIFLLACIALVGFMLLLRRRFPKL